MKIGQLLTEIPPSIDNFYEKILRDPLGAGQNSTLIHETFHKDWQSRPNCMNPYGKGIFSPPIFFGYVIIRDARAVRITVRPERVLKCINKYIYKILKHALDQN